MNKTEVLSSDTPGSLSLKFRENTKNDDTDCVTCCKNDY